MRQVAKKGPWAERMPDEQFAQAFGTEWFVDAARYAVSPQRQGDLVTSLFD